MRLFFVATGCCRQGSGTARRRLGSAPNVSAGATTRGDERPAILGDVIDSDQQLPRGGDGRDLRQPTAGQLLDVALERAHPPAQERQVLAAIADLRAVGFAVMPADRARGRAEQRVELAPRQPGAGRHSRGGPGEEHRARAPLSAPASAGHGGSFPAACEPPLSCWGVHAPSGQVAPTKSRPSRGKAVDPVEEGFRHCTWRRWFPEAFFMSFRRATHARSRSSSDA